MALGYHLDEIPNDITRLTPASFEPTIDYVDEPNEVAVSSGGHGRRDAAVIDLTAADAHDEPPRLALEA